jgi:hypothetical protein
MDVAWLMFVSPLLAAVVCVVIVRVTVGRRGIDRREAIDDLAGHLFFGITLGLVGGIAVPILWLFGWNAPDAPLFAVLTVPLGLAIGAVGATAIWSYRATDA